VVLLELQVKEILVVVELADPPQVAVAVVVLAVLVLTERHPLEVLEALVQLQRL
jgi:hypothetical protein